MLSFFHEYYRVDGSAFDMKCIAVCGSDIKAASVAVEEHDGEDCITQLEKVCIKSISFSFAMSWLGRLGWNLIFRQR